MTTPDPFSLRYTGHARARMLEAMVEAFEIQATVANPDEVTVGELLVSYDAVIGGRRVSVVLLKDSDPPLVVSVLV